MNSAKDLEEAIKEKVAPLLEETMEKNWGITIPQIESDITDKLKNPPLQVYIPTHSTLAQAKKLFREEFIKKELRLHQGNISQLAKTLDIDRRSIHRAVKELNVDVDKIRAQLDSPEKYREEVIDQTIRSALDQYKEIIQPHQLEKFYQDIPELSRNIAKLIPHSDLTWDEAERDFERQFLALALHEHGENVAKTAEALKIRAETLHRKAKKLGLR